MFVQNSLREVCPLHLPTGDWWEQVDKAAGRERVDGSSSTLWLALGKAQDGVEVTWMEGEDTHSVMCCCVARQQCGPPVAEFSSKAAD